MTETNNVYTAFRHILEDYDGIAFANIDYNNVSDYRSDWTLGRQLLERKKSNEYLAELARQTFVGIYPLRTGYRGLKAWREDETIIATHTTASGSIIAGSISKFEQTPISKTFNEFRVQYDYNPGADRFNKEIFIKKTDENAFPDFHVSTGTDTPQTFISVENKFRFSSMASSGIHQWYVKITVADEPTWATTGAYLSFDGDDEFDISFARITGYAASGSDWIIMADHDNEFGVAKNDICLNGTLYLNGSMVRSWCSYVGGIGDYTTARAWWLIAAANYAKSNTINPMPEDLGKCYWFPDDTDFDEYAGTSDTSAYKFIDLLLEWCALQKDVVEYSIPITAANVQLELLDPVYFCDVKYTAGANRMGYITMIKHVPFDRIVLEVCLIPTDIVEENLIIETGSAATTITESGSQTDTYTET